MRKVLKVLLRLPIFVALWALFVVLKLPTIVTGYVMVALLWRYRRTDYKDLPWWTRPWSNFEDWQNGPNSWWKPGADSLPGWWVTRRRAEGFEGTDFWSWYKYHAIRNGANGLRSFDFLSLNLYEGNLNYVSPRYFDNYEPRDLRKAGKRAASYFAWSGWKAGFKFVIIVNDKYHISVKWGWRINPRDVEQNPFFDSLMENNPALYGPGGKRDRTMLYSHVGFASNLHPFGRKG